MNIVWRGDSCFQITSQIAKNNPVKIVIDPLQGKPGARSSKMEADILLESSDKADISRIKGEPFVINGPGEFEVRGVFMQGIQISESSTAYILEAENIRILHIRSLTAQGINNNGMLEKIGDIDILMAPIGKEYGSSAGQAAEIAKSIDPKIIIPMLYKTSSQDLDEFLKIMGKKNIEKQSRISIKKKDLLKMEKEIIVLEP